MPERSLTKRGLYAMAALMGLASLCTAAVGNGDIAPPPAPSLTAYTAHYTLEKKGLTIAEATFTLSKNGNHWLFESHAEPRGLAALLTNRTMTERSVFRLVDGRVEPDEYRLKHGGSEKAGEEDVHVVYDRTAGVARVRHGQKQTTLALDRPLYDPLSEQVALMLEVRRADPKPDYRVIDDGQAERHRFTFEGTESIETPAGKQPAVKTVRTHGKRRTLIWFAPALNYLPIRIESYKDGELKSTLTLETVDFSVPDP